MAPFLKNYNILVVFPLPSISKDYTRDRVSAWVKCAGGTLASNFTDETTHVVCDEKAWRNEVMAVQQAKEKGKQVKIVSPSWLEDVLRDQRKVKEGAYLWEKLDKGSSAGTSKAMVDGDNGEIEGPKSVPGLMGEVFHEATEAYLSERDRRRLEAEAEGRERVRRELEAEEKQKQERAKRLEAERKRQEANERKKAARRGRNEVFTEHHHVYKDPTGFAYDIMLTKVDTTRNINERITLTVFESNAEPNTYATNMYFAGTARKAQNNILAAIGTNLPTAFRLFRKAFRERTGVDWDDRIKAHNQRIKDRDQGRADTSLDLDFEKRPFRYVPPGYGARGLLPKNGSTWQPETVMLNPEPRQASESIAEADIPRESVEQVMSGALEADAGVEQGDVAVETTADASIEDIDYAGVMQKLKNADDGMQVDFTQDDEAASGQQQFDFDDEKSGALGGGVAANDANYNISMADNFEMAAVEGMSGYYGFATGDEQLPLEVPDSQSVFPVNSFGSVPGQTQMAEQVGQEFLGLENGGNASGEGSPGLGKRKRQEEIEEINAMVGSFQAEAEAEYGV